MSRREEEEQINLCDYIKETYPDVVFTSDQSGIRVGQGLANKLKRLRSGNKIPDFSMDEPRGGYYGFKLELKATGNNPFRKNGMIKNDEHLRGQYKMLLNLYSKGYYTCFAVGYEQAKELIDWVVVSMS